MVYTLRKVLNRNYVVADSIIIEIMRGLLMKKSHLFNAIIAIALLVAPPSFAATFSWTPGNTGIVTNTDSLQLTVGGITATVQAFTAEINTAGTDANVIGPWPTQVGINNAGLGIDVRGLGSEQLGLIADTSLIPAAGGSDFFSGGLSPGFSSGYGKNTVGNPAPPAFHFALFSFDKPVDIPGVTVDDVTNQPRAVWMATGTTVPDFTGGFFSGLAGFNIFNSPDDTADGLFTHNLGATGISYLFVGAPPANADLGPLAALPFGQGSNFFIDSFDATVVPVPAAVWLFGSGLLGLVGVARRKKV